LARAFWRNKPCARYAGTEKATSGGHGSGSEDPPPRDAVIKITACAICGSDLHLLDGYQPTMESGDILGHENMGEVIELGSEVTNLKIGDRVIVPFTISCGQCWFCQKGLFSCCDRTNPNAEMAAKAMGQSPAGLFGFHMLGGYSGGQACISGCRWRTSVRSGFRTA
jgi:threonine dehydrogenase-like Zn-dependent dehydrogenase